MIKQEYNEEVKKDMKERLKKIACRKIETTMIYPLSEFEVNFGHLWGHGKPESILTEEEKIYRRKWDRCRNSVLNNGNKQKRGLTAEIDMHTVVWNRYQTVFIPRSV